MPGRRNVPRSPMRSHAERVALYAVDDVCSALGIKAGVKRAGISPSQGDEHHACLESLLFQGERGRWRSLMPPPPGAEDAISKLVARAPHLTDLASLVLTHLRSSKTIGLAVRLPPVLLVGEPGLGKSWFLSRLGAALGLPFRRYAMNSSTLAEGLQGAHPSWRNSQPGLVARTLLYEKAANPIFFIDEVDKANANGYNGDPYRAFYSLLDHSDATAFVDEFLGFPMDASNALWIMAGNDLSVLPEPILDRVRILTVSEPDSAHHFDIAASIYTEANERYRCFFDAEPDPDLIERLIGMKPRTMRKALEEAMASASARGRRRLLPGDIALHVDRTRIRIGFCR